MRVIRKISVVSRSVTDEATLRIYYDIESFKHFFKLFFFSSVSFWDLIVRHCTIVEHSSTNEFQ